MKDWAATGRLFWGLCCGSVATIGRRRLDPEALDQLVEADHFLAGVGSARAERPRPLLGLPLAYDEQTRHLGEAVIAQLVVDLSVAKVRHHADSPLAQPLLDHPRLLVAVGDNRRPTP